MQQTSEPPKPEPTQTPPVFDPADSGAGMEIDPEDLQPRPWFQIQPSRGRIVGVSLIVLTLLLLVFLPPLISVNRFRRRIVQSVSESVGRPVRMGDVSLNVLPTPGFTLQNFVVGEDPAFGSEPVIQARSVKVTLRVWSLWRRRVEFSRISLEDPSVNLVHRADGRWNIESIILQAAKIEAAPTAQTSASGAPRFPYIEATGARINVKMDLEKMPLSLTEADLALWLPDPQQWRLRLEGHPSRTDTSATDTGTMQIQGTLGRAATLRDVPIDLNGEWRAAPLGGVGFVLRGQDSGLRGEMTLRTSLQGTVGENRVASDLALTGLRRADFVPARPFDAGIHCTAQALALFHSLRAVECSWLTGGTAPVPESGAARPFGVRVQGEIPDLWRAEDTARFASQVFLPASQFLDLLRIASNRVGPDLSLSGNIDAALSCCTTGGQPSAVIAGKSLRLAVGNSKPFVDQDVPAHVTAGELIVPPLALNLGAPQPALLEANAARSGYTLHLSGFAMRSRLLALAQALPQFGDGLEAALPAAPLTAAAPEVPIRLDLTATRSWQSGQTWSTTAVRQARPARRRR